MSDEVLKVTEAPAAAPFAGSLLLSIEPFEFTPAKMLDALGFAEENRPCFIMRPMTAKQRHFIEGDNARMQSEGGVWARKNGIDLQGKDIADFYILAKKWDEFSDKEKRRDITRSCIVGFKGQGLGEFTKSEKDNGLSEQIFERFPTELATALEMELIRRNSLTNDDALGL